MTPGSVGGVAGRKHVDPPYATQKRETALKSFCLLAFMINKFHWLLSFLAFAGVLTGSGATPPASAVADSAHGQRSWVNPARCAGQRDAAPVTRADFRQLVFELQAHRATRAAGVYAPQQLQPYARLKAARDDPRGRVPLSVIHWSRVLERRTPAAERAAWTAAAEPALTNVTVFACAPVRPITFRGAGLTLALDPEDLFEEIASADKAIATVRVDAGDGRGWQGLQPGEEATASYAATGTRTVRLEATLADGSVLSAAFSLEVAALSTPDPTETVPVGGGQLFLYKKDAHPGLRCPVLVVEGFDMNNDMGWDALYNILNKEQLAETLRACGRDLVVLDFADATADILSNAGVAIHAINYVNSQRLDLADKFTVIGASMGGLVSRNALAKMDMYPATYGQSLVATWISFDSPQEGANIPLGLQEFFKFFGGYADSYSDLAMALDYKEKVDSPAAQQMLLCHYKANTTLAARSPNYASFDTTIKTYGYPTKCKKIAIANGSKYGATQPFLPSAKIIHWVYSSYWTVDISCDVYALNRSSATSKTVFYGLFDPFDLLDLVDDTAVKYRYYPYGVDNAAGGTRASFQEMFDSLPSDMKDADDYCQYANHCFIPTTSALGIPKEYMETPVDGHPTVAALSPFDEIHCASVNEPHIDINANNKRWLMRAILEGVDTDGDGFDDYQESLMGTDYASSASTLRLATGFVRPAASGNWVLSWDALPNVSYQVYFTESLGQAWTRIDSVMFATRTAATRTYPFDAAKKTGFYKMTAQVVDPVTD